MKRIAMIALLLFVCAATAQAGTALKLRKSESVVRWYEHRGSWHLRPGLARCSQLRASRAADRCYRHRLNYRWHLARAARLAPRPALPHLAGWTCIHEREGAWNAQTGNGFYGGLQMTYGWMGLVANAALLSPRDQILAAERGYRTSGHSDRWMRGQWPSTYPPCARLF